MLLKVTQPTNGILGNAALILEAENEKEEDQLVKIHSELQVCMSVQTITIGKPTSLEVKIL